MNSIIANPELEIAGKQAEASPTLSLQPLNFDDWRKHFMLLL